MTSILSLLLLSLGQAQGEEVSLVVRVVRSARDARNPQGALWRKVRPVRLPLRRQDVVPPYGGGSVPRVDIRAIHDGVRVFFLFEWEDPTKDVARRSLRTFTDAVAIMFPLDPNDPPGPHMGQRYLGERNAVVNIWRYRADTNTAEDLYAAGIGTLAVQESQDVSGRGFHDGRRWRVVLWRFMRTKDDADALFRAGEKTTFNVAVWNGSREEVAGMKSVSHTWHRLSFQARR